MATVFDKILDTTTGPKSYNWYRNKVSRKTITKWNGKSKKTLWSNNVSNEKSDVEVKGFLDAFKETVVSKKTYEVDAEVLKSVKKEISNKEKEESVCDNDGNMMIINNSKPDCGSNIYSQNFQTWLQEQSK